MPWVVKAFVNLMWPFVDANTKKKVRFGEDIVASGEVDPGELLKECGGDLEVSYVYPSRGIKGNQGDMWISDEGLTGSRHMTTSLTGPL